MSPWESEAKIIPTSTSIGSPLELCVPPENIPLCPSPPGGPPPSPGEKVPPSIGDRSGVAVSPSGA